MTALKEFFNVIIHSIKTLHGDKPNRHKNYKIRLPEFYAPSEVFKSDDVYDKNGELNAIIELVYDTKEMNGYTIIDNYNKGNFSLITKNNSETILVVGAVISIEKKLFHIEIVTGIRFSNLGMGISPMNCPCNRYILRKDLTEHRLMNIAHNIKKLGTKHLLLSIIISLMIPLSMILSIYEFFGWDTLDGKRKYSITDIDRLHIDDSGNLHFDDKEDLQYIVQ